MNHDITKSLFFLSISRNSNIKVSKLVCDLKLKVHLSHTHLVAIAVGILSDFGDDI